MIKAQIVADSLSPQRDRLISVLATFPRIILAEVNTHRMLSKNTSSSRAIPFYKMIQAIQENPFIPTAWQKEHKGMQGTEYFQSEDGDNIHKLTEAWLVGRDVAVQVAQGLTNSKVTKQLANRLLEPFMWTTMLITGTLKGGWDNFFELRCPQYYFEPEEKSFKSRKEWMKCYEGNFGSLDSIGEKDDLWWLQQNQGQAEIHMMALAESIYDAVNESTPKHLKAGEWHIPFGDKILITENWNEDIEALVDTPFKTADIKKAVELLEVKISTAMAARTSYTVVGDEKEVDYKKMIELHDRLIAQNPPHSSPMEHCARVMSNIEYATFIKGSGTSQLGTDSVYFNKDFQGWCRNFKGFIPYRHIIESNS